MLLKRANTVLRYRKSFGSFFDTFAQAFSAFFLRGNSSSNIHPLLLIAFRAFQPRFLSVVSFQQFYPSKQHTL